MYATHLFEQDGTWKMPLLEYLDGNEYNLYNNVFVYQHRIGKQIQIGFGNFFITGDPLYAFLV
jgi:hypothetical protein